MQRLKTWFSDETPDMNFHTIDIFRGLAALWVVFHHSFVDHHFIIGESQIYDVLQTFFLSGSRGIEIFFVISGYCIFVSAEKNIHTPFKFLKHRIKRIIPPYWMSIVFGVVFVFIILQTGLTKKARLPDIYDLVVSLPLLRQTKLGYFNSPYWTLTHEMHFYLLVFCLIFLFRKKFIYIADAITAILITTGLDGNILSGMPVLNQVLTLRSTWFMFYAGILVYRIIRDVHRPLLIYHILWVAILVFYQMIDPRNLYDMFTVYFMLLLLCCRILDKKILGLKIMKPFFKLGMISYSLYLIHIMLAPKMMGVLQRLFTLNNTSVLLIFFSIILPITLTVAYYFHLYCEKPFVHRRTGVYLKVPG